MWYKAASVVSPTVRIIAFQAIDPGSTPGRRKFFCYILCRLLILRSHYTTLRKQQTNELTQEREQSWGAETGCVPWWACYCPLRKTRIPLSAEEFFEKWYITRTASIFSTQCPPESIRSTLFSTFSVSAFHQAWTERVLTLVRLRCIRDDRHMCQF